jgi:cytochrome c oxidase subunit 2
MNLLIASSAVSVSPLSCAGRQACRIAGLYVVIFWIALAVLLIVGTFIVYAAFRFRRRDEREPVQIHGNTRLEVAWTVVPLVIVVVIFTLTFTNMTFIRNGPPPEMSVTVVGRQFTWEYIYAGGKVRSFDALRIPTGTVVRINVTSIDVLHSFWVPRLAGQVYAIPGRTNPGWLEADKPGSYFGECNEFCGLGHYTMQATVIALTPTDFQRWYQAQLARA